MKLSTVSKIKLAKMLLKFEDIATEEGMLTVDGDLEVGKEAFMTDDNGDLQPASDGQYHYGTQVITIEGGVVTAIVEESVEEEQPVEEETPAEEEIVEVVEEAEAEEEEAPVAEEEETPVEEETPAEEEPVQEDARIAELEARIAELEARIAELEAENADLRSQLAEAEQPVEEPADIEFKRQDLTNEKMANITNVVKFLHNRK